MRYDLAAIVSNFQIYGHFLGAEPYGSGHINDTFASAFDQAGVNVRYIHQRINHNVFTDPEGLMDNVYRVTKHLNKKNETRGLPEPARRALTVVPDLDGQPYYRDHDGNYWRTYLFIEKSRTYDIIETEQQAYSTGRAFGEFQKLLVDMDGPRLKETIPNFHNTSLRFDDFKKALAADTCNRAQDARKEIDFILKNEDACSLLIDLHKNGEIPERITHNDTKLNNVMIDNETQEGICVIDLDTVMPGLVHYDFGDMIRTSTSPAAEDEQDTSKVCMQMNMFQALARGYIENAGDFLTKKEKEMLPFSGRLITLTIGIRFLTDYLSGDIYFKIQREGHNLDRCRTQLALVRSIEEQLEDMNMYLEGLTR